MSLNLEQYAGKKEFPVVDAGKYEMVVYLSRKWTNDRTKEFVNMDFFIRDDVEQKFKGAHVFDKAWADLNNPQWFDLKKLGSILVTQKNKPNYKTSFDEVDECIQYLNGVALVAYVEKQFDDYMGKEVNSIKYLSYEPTSLGAYVKPVAENASAPAAAPVPGTDNAVGANLPNIDPNDIPF